MLHIEIDQAPTRETIDALEKGLERYNLQFAPPYEFGRIAVVLRDEDGTLMGGIHGASFWGWLYIDVFWLDESVRRQGWGEKILRTAEEAGRARGCHHALLDTLDFQALPFYLKYGYAVFGELDDFPLGHKRYYLQKAL